MGTHGGPAWRLFVATIAAVGALSATAPPAAGQTQVTPPAPAETAGTLYLVEPSTISITGFVDDPDSLVRTLTLRAQGGDVNKVTFIPSDLTRASDKLEVDRSRISFVGGGPIASGEYATVQVKVTGLTEPGTYSGSIRMLTAGQTLGHALKVPLSLVAKERPAVIVEQGAKLKVQVTRCWRWLSCWIAKAVPGGGKDRTTTIFAVNSGRADATIADAQILAPGTVGGNEFGVDTPTDWKTLPAGKTTKLSLTIPRQDLSPDHYVGSAVVAITDKTDRLTIPVDVAVRAGPGWVILALLGGILLGRLALHMQDRGNRQASQLSQHRLLRDDVKARLRAEDRSLLDERLRAVTDQIYGFELDAAGTELAGLRGAVATLVRARALEDEIASQTDEWANEARQKLATARGQIRVGEDDAAEKTVNELVVALHTRRQAQPQKPALARAVPLAEAVETAAAVGPRVAAEVAGDAALTLAGAWAKVRRWAFRLAGFDQALAAEARLRVIRPLLLILLVLVLVGVGFKALYLSSDSFGASGFTDYFGLVLWGLGADVARRTLVGVAGGAP